MVRIRLQRHGRKNRPYFRLVAADIRAPRDGRTIEVLGHYDPLQTDAAKVSLLNAERIQYWLSVGAQPTETATSMLKRIGVKLPWQERAIARKVGKGGEAAKANRAAKPKKPKAATGAAGGEAQAPVDAGTKKAKREAKRSG
jgi:small subunit ribosomal protein S16